MSAETIPNQADKNVFTNIAQLNIAYLKTQFQRMRGRDLYEGADTVKMKRTLYLYPEQSELTDNDGKMLTPPMPNIKYDMRWQRACYDNLIQKIINWRQALLFKKAPHRELPQIIEQYADNVDGRGTSTDGFFTQVARDAQIDGIRFVQVDLPELPKTAYVSKADEELAGHRPYFRSIPADYVIDWAFDRQYQPMWVVLRRIKPDTRPLPGIVHVTQFEYVVWRRDIWQVYDQGMHLIDEGVNPAGLVPIIPFYGIRDDEYDWCGWPVCRPVFDHVLLKYNKMSDLDWFERLSSHPTPWIVAPKEPVVLDVSRGIWIPSEEGRSSSIGLLETTGTGFNSLRESISRLEASVMSTMLAQSKKDSGQVESADTQRESKRMLTASLKSVSHDYERSELKCWHAMLALLNASEQSSAVSVQYNRDFDDTMIDSAMVNMMTQLVSDGMLMPRTLLRIMVDAELLPADFDIDQELKDLEQKSTQEALETLKALRSMGPAQDVHGPVAATVAPQTGTPPQETGTA